MTTIAIALHILAIGFGVAALYLLAKKDDLR